MSRSHTACLMSALALAAVALSGCIEVRTRTPEEIRIDTGTAGELAPGTRSWWGYLRAREHCAAFGKEAKLVNFEGTVAVYRCIPPEN